LNISSREIQTYGKPWTKLVVPSIRPIMRWVKNGAARTPHQWAHPSMEHGPQQRRFLPNAIDSDVQHDPDSKLKVDPGHSQFKFWKCSLDHPLHEFLYFNIILRD
jgi:hypothetical protein